MYDVGTIDFAVYEDSDEFLGIANATMPDKNSKVVSMSGAGIGGDVEVPVPGHYDAMSLTLNFRTYTERAAKLREHRRHNIELRAAQQNEDPVTGVLNVSSVKHVLVVVPKSASGGTLAPAASAEVGIGFSVRYWATFINGIKVDEIDQLNRIDIINGIDYNEPVRKALGK